MVVRSVLNLERLEENISMASTAPAKTQPLHNFSLPHLKWKKNHANNHHRGRRFSDSPPQQSPPPDSALRRSPQLDSASQSPMRESIRRPSPMRESAPRHSPMRDYGSESEARLPSSAANGFLHENRNNSASASARRGSSPASHGHILKNCDKESAESDYSVSGTKEVRSKILFRFPVMNKPDGVQDEGKSGADGGETEELAAKTWNLRPRRSVHKQSNASGGTPKVGGPSLQENKTPSSQAAVNHSESVWCGSGPETNLPGKGKRPKFSISLTREEIEEDIFAMTGSKPARRPKKRPQKVQRNLDNLFPGLWLSSVTPDLYKVPEAPPKG